MIEKHIHTYLLADRIQHCRPIHRHSKLSEHEISILHGHIPNFPEKKNVVSAISIQMSIDIVRFFVLVATVVS